MIANDASLAGEIKFEIIKAKQHLTRRTLYQQMVYK
jgi:hypothetical protein